MQICLYGASSDNIARIYIEKTEELGAALAAAGHTMVYGGGGAGLMGAAARGFKAENGRVIGVVPRFLKVDGILYENCDEMLYTDTMRERKQIMEERAEGFIVTPGGIGTYEEFFEIYTLKQLGRHGKPIVIYNINGYYDDMLSMLQRTVHEGFMREKSLSLITVADTPRKVLEQLERADGTTVDFRTTKFVR